MEKMASEVNTTTFTTASVTSDKMSRCLVHSQRFLFLFPFPKCLSSISNAKRRCIRLQTYPSSALYARAFSSHTVPVPAHDDAQVLLLGPLDNIMPRHHISPKALFLPASGSSQEDILATLKSGLAQTIKAVPSVAGHVKLAPDPIQKGGMCVSAPFSTVDDILTARDLTESHPEMDFADLKGRHFPIEALDPDLLYSLPAFMDAEKPVFLAQANFIRGGLVLGISLHPSFGDATTLKIILQIWAACCRGKSSKVTLHERLTSSETDATLDEFPEYAAIPANIASCRPEMAEGEGVERAPMPPQVDSHVFYVSFSKLMKLRNLAAAELEGTDKIKTRDALLALLWRSITVAQNPECGKAAIDDTQMLNIQLDRRRPMDLDWSYMGNMVLVNNVTAPLQSLLSSPPQLSQISFTIRQSISRMDERYIKRAISAIRSVPDVSKVMMSGGTFGESALTISSWSDLYMDWGHVIGGRSKRVRVPKIPVSGLCVVLAGNRSPNRSAKASGVELMIGLKSDDMARLRKDPFFTSFANWRC